MTDWQFNWSAVFFLLPLFVGIFGLALCLAMDNDRPDREAP